jgi:hypothetical protein
MNIEQGILNVEVGGAPKPSLRGTKQSVLRIAAFLESEAQIASFLTMTFNL